MGTGLVITGPQLAAAAWAVGVDLESLVEQDMILPDPGTTSKLFLSRRVTGQDLSGLAGPHGFSAIEDLGPALHGIGHITISAEADVVAGVGDTGPAPLEQLSEFVANLPSRPATQYTVEISVDKTALMARIATESVGRDRLLFLFGDSLVRILQMGMAGAASLWDDPARPQVIALLDVADLRVEGALLRVVGGSELTREAVTSLPPGKDTARVSTCRDEHIAWTLNWADDITPAHFELSIEVGADTPVARALASQSAKLTLAHVCDRVRTTGRADGSAITADLRSSSHAASVPFDDSDVDQPIDHEQSAALAALIEWIYRESNRDAHDWVFDRLQFAQISIARLLETARSIQSSEPPLVAFVRISTGLAKSLDHQWETYVEGKLDAYAEKVAQVEVEASTAVARYNERVASIVKSVTDTALAALGVIVGTFIAAAFNDPFNRELFEIGLVIYAAYVIIVPLLWGQAAHMFQFRQVQRVHEARLMQFRTVLDGVDANEVVKTASGAPWKFWTWWGLACVLYLGLVMAMVIAIHEVPDRILGDAAAMVFL